MYIQGNTFQMPWHTLESAACVCDQNGSGSRESVRLSGTRMAPPSKSATITSICKDLIKLYRTIKMSETHRKYDGYSSKFRGLYLSRNPINSQEMDKNVCLYLHEYDQPGNLLWFSALQSVTLDTDINY